MQNTDLGSSQEIIPFRESKLTHLLMPILNRAGMSGTAMIACVNPQVDDYDETISILGEYQYQQGWDACILSFIVVFLLVF